MRAWLASRWRRAAANPVHLRILRGGFWATSGAVVSRGLLLLSTILVARMLGEAGFGELGVIQGTVGLFAIFAGFSLGTTATKYVAQFRTTDPDRAGRIVALASAFSGGMALAVSLVLWLAADWLASETLAAPHLGPLLRAGVPFLFLTAVTAAQFGVLAGLESFRTLAHVNVALGLLNCLLLPAGAYSLGVAGTVHGLTLSQLAVWFVNHRVIRRQLGAAGIRPDWRGAWRERGVLWSFSAPSILAGVVSVAAQWLANAWLVNQPRGYEEMGVFNATNQWRSVMAFASGMLSQILMPVLSDLHGRRDMDVFRQTLRVNLRLIALANAALCVPLVAAAPWIMGFYGPGFAEGGLTLRLAVAASAIASVLTIVGSALTSLGRMWDCFFLNAIWTAAFLAGARLGAPCGAEGLAGALLAAYLVHLVSVLLYYRYLLPGIMKRHA